MMSYDGVAFNQRSYWLNVTPNDTTGVARFSEKKLFAKVAFICSNTLTLEL
jgi:hypothetical protein